MVAAAAAGDGPSMHHASSLTLDARSVLAPASSSIATILSWPLQEADHRGVLPSYKISSINTHSQSASARHSLVHWDEVDWCLSVCVAVTMQSSTKSNPTAKMQ